LKASIYLSIAVSIVFTVLGILFISGLLLINPYFNQNHSTRLIIGIVFIVYGLFRGYTGYLKLKTKNNDRETLL
jgi:hypothetical protein